MRMCSVEEYGNVVHGCAQGLYMDLQYMGMCLGAVYGPVVYGPAVYGYVLRGSIWSCSVWTCSVWVCAEGQYMDLQ